MVFCVRHLKKINNFFPFVDFNKIKKYIIATYSNQLINNYHLQLQPIKVPFFHTHTFIVTFIGDSLQPAGVCRLTSMKKCGRTAPARAPTLIGIITRPHIYPGQINQRAALSAWEMCDTREAEMSTVGWHYGWRASGHPSMHHYTVQVYGKQNRSE